MGLILQDLTFVHIGNQDNVKGKVNFAKTVAAVQHLGKQILIYNYINIIYLNFFFQDNLRRFKRENYHFERKESICQYFGNFEDSLSDNELWAISKKLKPQTFQVSSTNNNNGDEANNHSHNDTVWITFANATSSVRKEAKLRR